MTDTIAPPKALQRFEASDGFEALMAAVDADGAAIVHDFVSPDLLDRLDAELAETVRETAPGSDGVSPEMLAFWGRATKRFTRLAARSPAFGALLDHALMHRWAEHSLKAGYWLNTGQAMIVGPGEPAQYLHRDIAIWPYISAMGVRAPNAMVSILLALSDFTEEVGVTRVIPGSHLWDDPTRQGRPEETVGAVMPRGSAVLYLGKTVHGAGANTTSDQWRRGLHMSFCLNWLTPEEASPLGVPWEIARSFSPRVQQMLGYRSTAHTPGGAPVNWLVDFEDAARFVTSEA